MTKLALLDGDSWVYRCGFAAEKTHYAVVWDDPGLGVVADRRENHKDAKARLADVGFGEIYNRKEYEPLENCLQMVKTSLENTLKVLETNDYKLYLSGKRNFRDDLFGDYKGNRDGVSKPKYYRDIREYLVGQWGARMVDGMEADDAIGIDATSAGTAKRDFVVVAVDKDLDQIPGEHYNWTTGEGYSVSPQEGIKFFYQQLLSGDPTDNIPGLRGIGPVKAAKFVSELKTPKDCAEAIYKAYQEAGFNDEILDRNAHLIWIWRKENDTHPLWRHLGRVSI